MRPLKGILSLCCCAALGGCSSDDFVANYDSDVAIGPIETLLMDTGSGSLEPVESGDVLTEESTIAFLVTFYRISDIDFERQRRFNWSVVDDRGVEVSQTSSSFPAHADLVTRSSDAFTPTAGERSYRIRVDSVEGEDGNADNDQAFVYVDIVSVTGG